VTFCFESVASDVRAAFVEDISRRGPDVCWLKATCEAAAFSVEVCRAQASRGKAFLLELPVQQTQEETELFHTLVHDGIGRQFKMHETEVISNWGQLQAEYSGNGPCEDKAATVMVKLLETQRLYSLEQALLSILEEEESVES
jgi:hypothetical protein